MINYLEAPVAHEALFKKYASKKFLKGELVQVMEVDLETNATQHQSWLESGLRTMVLAVETVAHHSPMSRQLDNNPWVLGCEEVSSSALLLKSLCDF